MTEVLDRLPGTRRFPPVVYARLLLDLLLPPDVERVLHLDSDLYVRAPIEQLLEIDLGGNSFTAAPEPGGTTSWAATTCGPARARSTLPIRTSTPVSWSSTGAPGAGPTFRAYLETLSRSGEIARLYHDQDVLNLRFRGDWLALDPRWNVTKPHPVLRALDPYIIQTPPA